MSGILLWNSAIAWDTTQADGAMTTELNSLAAGYAALAANPIDNTLAANLKPYLALSCSLPSVPTGTGAPSLDMYALPLNQDGSTYGDGTVSGATAPSGIYLGSFRWNPSLASATQTDQLWVERAILPVKFKLAVVNNIGNALAASGNVIAFALLTDNLNG